MLLTTIKEFCIQHDVPLDVLRVAWIGGQKMSRFRIAFEQLHKLASQLQVTRILLELNSLPEIPVYDQLWLSAQFMPTVLGLPLQQLVISLASEQVYNQHVVENLLLAVQRESRFDVQFFTQGEAAMHWLSDNSPRLPALLAEWERGCNTRPGRASGVAEPLAQYLLL